MKKLVLGIVLSSSIITLAGCSNTSVIAIGESGGAWGGGYSYGLTKDNKEIDLYKLKEVDFKDGVLDLSVYYEGDNEKEFTITPLLNNQKISVDFDGEGYVDQYTTKIKNGNNKIRVKTSDLKNGIVSFIFKSGETNFGIYGYNNHDEMSNVIKEIDYDKLDNAKASANEEIVGEKGENIDYSFKVKLAEERFEGDNYGYKVFLDDTLIDIDGKSGKIFKKDKDILEDKINFKLPEEAGTYDLYIARDVNPIDDVQPIGNIIFKTKVTVV